jgi:YVTN family beta-propeller protein
MKNAFIVLTLLAAFYGVAKADWVTTTVAAGNAPRALGVNPVTNMIYVANQGGNTVTVINGATNATTTVTAGTGCFAVAVNPVTNKIYVANPGSNNVTVINGATNDTTTVAVGAQPVAVAVNPVTNKIYVSNYGSASVTVIDGATNSTMTIPAGNSPRALAGDPVTGKIYVPNYRSGNVTVIDEALVLDTKVWALTDSFPNHTTTQARPALAGRGVNRWTPKPTTRIEGVLNRLNTAQRSWNWAQITNGGGTDSVAFAYNWGTDSLIKGENFVLGVALESDAAIMNNLGLGTPFAGNLMVYPLYRIDPPSGAEEGRVGRRLAIGRITIRPNPFTSFAVVSGHESEWYNLYDVTGRNVGKYKGDRIGEGLRAGVYFVRGKEGKPVRIVKVR